MNLPEGPPLKGDMRAVALALLLFCESPRTENAVTRALLYLARHQADDGSWGGFDPVCGCRPAQPIETELPIPIDPDVERRFTGLLEDLAQDDASSRERAQRKVRALAGRAVPLLQRSLGHPDPEVAWRCRQTLTSIWKEDPEVRELRLRIGRREESDRQVFATGLGVLCFLGAGYTQLSRDEWQDVQGRRYMYGAIVKKAAQWLLAKQEEDGSFAARDPVAHAVATAAISELYGCTACWALHDPAAEAVTYLNSLQCTEPSFLLWKGVALHSGHLSEVRWCDNEACGRMAEDLSQLDTSLGLAGAFLFKSCHKQETRSLRDRLSYLDPKTLSPMETWVVTCASLQVKEEPVQPWKALPPAQIQGSGCTSGSWSLVEERWDESLITTMYSTLTLERSYRYALALFQFGCSK